MPWKNFLGRRRSGQIAIVGGHGYSGRDWNPSEVSLGGGDREGGKRLLWGCRTKLSWIPTARLGSRRKGGMHLRGGVAPTKSGGLRHYLTSGSDA
jgi:hypothetical protein